MAIKKPQLKKKSGREETENARVDPDEDEPKKKILKKRIDSDEDEPKKKSLAELFDETTPGGGLFPVGDFKAYVVGLELEGEIADDPDDQKELKVKITFEGHEDEDEVAEKTISNWYNIADADGEIGPGVPFFKKDMDILGYEDVKFEDIEELCKQIVQERPAVNIIVKESKGYTNAYLQSLAD